MTTTSVQPGDWVRYPFDGSAGVVAQLVTRRGVTYAIVSFPGKAPREIPRDRLERIEAAR